MHNVLVENLLEQAEQHLEDARRPSSVPMPSDWDRNSAESTRYATNEDTLTETACLHMLIFATIEPITHSNR